MEVALNVVWASVSLILFACCWGTGERRSSSTGFQLLALGALVLILFPIISISDDYCRSAQMSPEETSSQHDHSSAAENTMTPQAAVPPAPDLTALTLVFFGLLPAGEPRPSALLANSPLSLFNRPPPIA